MQEVVNIGVRKVEAKWIIFIPMPLLIINILQFEWNKWLEIHQTKVGKRRLKLLDVACGSGKFPSALFKYSKLADAKILPIEYALLDPSSFSIKEARKVLQFR